MLESEGDAFGFIKRKLSAANHAKATHKPKSKNRQIIEASPAYLTLEGEGDTFWFHQT
jgi:hypothetical protein